MSEIVYTETDKQRAHIASMGHGRTQADKKFTLFQSRDKVALVISSLVVGVPVGHNKDTGLKEPLRDKRYYYWRSHYSLGFRRNRAGNVVPYQCQRMWDCTYRTNWAHQQAGLPFELLRENVKQSFSERLTEEFRHAVWGSFNVTRIEDIFPMLPVVGLERYNTIPHNLHSAFRQNTWEEYAAAAFGKTRVTPRLVAAVKNTEPYFVAYARNFRGLVSNEALCVCMERNHFDDEMEENFQPYTPDFRAGILQAEQTTVDGLIGEKLDFNDLVKIRHIVGTGKHRPIYFQRRPGAAPAVNWSQIYYW